MKKETETMMDTQTFIKDDDRVSRTVDFYLKIEKKKQKQLYFTHKRIYSQILK